MNGEPSQLGTLLPGAAQAQPAAPTSGGHGPSGRGRSMLLIGLVAAVAGLALIGYLVFGNSAPNVAGGAVPTHHRTATATASATTSPARTTSSPAVTLRNPFLDTSSASPSTTTSTAASTVTVTATSTASSIYLGLFGFTSSGKAQFWVNSGFFTAAAGSSFDGSFTYLRRNSAGCALVRYQSRTLTVCQRKGITVG